MHPSAKRTLFAACAFVLVLSLFEGGLRLLGLPQGFFGFVELAPTPYLPHATLTMRWGPIEYQVRANSAGFRGDGELTERPLPGVTRILAIGDSMTNGFFVDNADTYPARLQAFLRARGVRAEVVNGARGGGTITDQFDLLKTSIRFHPMVVILMFVTNDIADLMDAPVAPGAMTPLRRALTWTAVHTATGELLGRVGYALRTGSGPRAPRSGSTRYVIAGGNDFAGNARLFTSMFGSRDGIVLGEAFAPGVERAFARYLELLGQVDAYCREHGAQLALVYAPAYTQIYGTASMNVRDRLEKASRAGRIPFYDLTPDLVREGHDRVLHLAPLDFHPNPTGNGVIADAIGQWLLVAGLVAPPAARRSPGR